MAETAFMVHVFVPCLTDPHFRDRVWEHAEALRDAHQLNHRMQPFSPDRMACHGDEARSYAVATESFDLCCRVRKTKLCAVVYVLERTDDLAGWQPFVYAKVKEDNNDIICQASENMEKRLRRQKWRAVLEDEHGL